MTAQQELTHFSNTSNLKDSLDNSDLPMQRRHLYTTYPLNPHPPWEAAPLRNFRFAGQCKAKHRPCFKKAQYSMTALSSDSNRTRPETGAIQNNPELGP